MKKSIILAIMVVLAIICMNNPTNADQSLPERSFCYDCYFYPSGPYAGQASCDYITEPGEVGAWHCGQPNPESCTLTGGCRVSND